MTHTPETRTTYWWTLKQIREADHVIGGTANNVVQYGDRIWKRIGPAERVIGMVTTKDERRPGDLGAWLPEPPPPETLSDEEIIECLHTAQYHDPRDEASAESWERQRKHAIDALRKRERSHPLDAEPPILGTLADAWCQKHDESAPKRRCRDVDPRGWCAPCVAKEALFGPDGMRREGSRAYTTLRRRPR